MMVLGALGSSIIKQNIAEMSQLAQVTWYVTPTGTGSGLGWDDPCSLDFALTNCSDNVRDKIILGAGIYDANRAGDGYVCDKDNVSIEGTSINKTGPGLTNFHASATSVLKVTGDLFTCANMQFRGTDVATALELNGGFYAEIEQCVIVNGPTGNVLGTGVKLTNGQNATTISFCLFSQSEISLLFDNCFQCIIGNCLFSETATGIKFAGTDETQVGISKCIIEETSDVGFHLAGANVSDIRFHSNSLLNNVDDIKDASGTFGQVLMYDLLPSQQVRRIWPGEDGIGAATGSGPWVWGTPVTFLDSLDIPEPFFVVQFNVQSADPAPTNQSAVYEVEIYAGPNLGTQVLAGAFQLVVGDFRSQVGAVSVTRAIGQYFQPTLAATYRIKSSMTGIKNAVIAMEYYIL